VPPTGVRSGPGGLRFGVRVSTHQEQLTRVMRTRLRTTPGRLRTRPRPKITPTVHIPALSRPGTPECAHLCKPTGQAVARSCRTGRGGGGILGG
jgi:hypothetical protein